MTPITRTECQFNGTAERALGLPLKVTARPSTFALPPKRCQMSAEHDDVLAPGRRVVRGNRPSHQRRHMSIGEQCRR